MEDANRKPVNKLLEKTVVNRDRRNSYTPNNSPERTSPIKDRVNSEPDIKRARHQ